MSTETQVRILPLWKEFVRITREGGKLTYGAAFTTAEMEQALACNRDSLEFQFAVSDIKRALRREGKNWTARGQNGEGFVITQPGRNRVEMERLQKAAITQMKEGVILGGSTPLELLNQEDRAKHEAVMGKMATRLALINRRVPHALT